MSRPASFRVVFGTLGTAEGDVREVAGLFDGFVWRRRDGVQFVVDYRGDGEEVEFDKV